MSRRALCSRVAPTSLIMPEGMGRAYHLLPSEEFDHIFASKPSFSQQGEQGSLGHIAIVPGNYGAASRDRMIED